MVWQSNVKPHTYEELFVLPGEHPMHGPEGQPRVLPLEGAHNVRDLGGYPAREGQSTRWGVLYRADRLDRLTGDDLRALQELGVRVVCDFRLPQEAEEMPDRLPEGVDYRHMPVFEEDPVSRTAVLFNRHRLLEIFTEVYLTHIIDRGAPVYAGMFRLLADPDNLPLLFHCTAGKDRAGMGAALVLGALGVDRQVIVADYLLTNYTAERLIADVEHQLLANNVRGVSVEQLYPLLAAAPQLINAALDHIDEQYGSIEGYLTGHADLTTQTLAAVRANLLE